MGERKGELHTLHIPMGESIIYLMNVKMAGLPRLLRRLAMTRVFVIARSEATKQPSPSKIVENQLNTISLQGSKTIGTMPSLNVELPLPVSDFREPSVFLVSGLPRSLAGPRNDVEVWNENAAFSSSPFFKWIAGLMLLLSFQALHLARYYKFKRQQLQKLHEQSFFLPITSHYHAAQMNKHQPMTYHFAYNVNGFPIRTKKVA